MKLGVAEPRRLVDVSRLPHDAIEETADGALRIGAAVRNTDLATHPLIRERYPVLSEACSPAPRASCATSRPSAATSSSARAAATSRTSRSRATSAGPAPAARRVEGEHRNHAILGHSEHCVATHPSDMAVALAAHRRERPRARRQRRAHDPDPRPAPAARRQAAARHRPQRRRPDHRRRARRAPPRARRIGRSATGRASRSRCSPSPPRSRVEDGAVKEARIALGGVAHVPWRAERAEEVLRGAGADR